jgi:ATP-dependent Clp protease ATP-binding subunit ClpC
VFERFTDRGRRVVVLAQEEARMLNHNYIGTEHILLGLTREQEGVAGRALASLDISLEAVRNEVREIIGEGEEVSVGHIPFTPRAKKVLELALREALQLGHNYIGTEHLLLGLIREGEGVAAQVLQKLGADLDRVRHTVIQQLSGYGVGSGVGGAYVEMHDPASEEVLRSVPLCPTCSRPLERTLRYRVLSAEPDEEQEEGEPLTVKVAYCTTCGRAIGTSPA